MYEYVLFNSLLCRVLLLRIVRLSSNRQISNLKSKIRIGPRKTSTLGISSFLQLEQADVLKFELVCEQKNSNFVVEAGSLISLIRVGKLWSILYAVMNLHRLTFLLSNDHVIDTLTEPVLTTVKITAYNYIVGCEQ